MAQERQRRPGYGTPYHPTYRVGRLDQVGLAWVGLRVEAAPGHRHVRRLDPAGGSAHPANTADNAVAPYLIERLPEEARFVLGDIHYNAPNVRRADAYEAPRSGSWSLPNGRHHKTDDGVEVERIFHKLRSVAYEELQLSISRPSLRGARAGSHPGGLINTQRFALGAVLVYQLALLSTVH